jgi:hypothetical protein
MLRVYGFTLLCFAIVYTLSSLAPVGIFAGKWNVGLQVQGNGMISLCMLALFAIFYLFCAFCAFFAFFGRSGLLMLDTFKPLWL